METNKEIIRTNIEGELDLKDWYYYYIDDLLEFLIEKENYASLANKSGRGVASQNDGNVKQRTFREIANNTEVELNAFEQTLNELAATANYVSSPQATDDGKETNYTIVEGDTIPYAFDKKLDHLRKLHNFALTTLNRFRDAM